MDGISREIHTFAFAMLGNINTILLVVVTALIAVAVIVVVVVVAAVVVVAVVIVVVAATEDVHGTVFMNVIALVETDVVEVVAPAGSAAVLAMANNQDRKVASMAPTARIEWVKVIALGHSSASGCGGVVTATGARITVFGQSVVGACYGDGVFAVNNRTSDGQADREGEGDNNGGETHDDCRDPVWYTAILSWECDWAGLFIPGHT